MSLQSKFLVKHAVVLDSGRHDIVVYDSGRHDVVVCVSGRHAVFVYDSDRHDIVVMSLRLLATKCFLLLALLNMLLQSSFFWSSILF